MCIMNNSEFKLDIDNIKNLVKFIASLKGFTMLSLKEHVNSKYKKDDGVRNLLNKLKNKTIKLSEIIEIADVLDYDVILKRRS
jgi:hypothetical protein